MTLSVPFLSVYVVPDINRPALLAKSIHYIVVFMVELGNSRTPRSCFTFANLDGNLESIASNA